MATLKVKKEGFSQEADSMKMNHVLTAPIT